MADTLQSVGRALQGFGAGVQGRGGQFLQGLDRQKLIEDKQIRQARGQDLIKIRGALARGDTAGAAEITQSRIDSGQAGGMDMANTLRLQEAILMSPAANVIGELDDDLRGLVATGDLEAGALGFGRQAQPKFIGQPVRVERDGKAFLSGIVQRADGSFGREDVPLEGELLSTLGETAAGQTARAIQEAGGRSQAVADVQLATKPGIEAATTTARGAAQLPIEEKKQTLQANTKRITELAQQSRPRQAAAKKARVFRDALESGEAFSGAGRKAAQFVPGVFTSQGQFDEKFNAFAEVAARQQLKASGELRPTDADVEGMKRAMFGVGRDETVNVELLNEFIAAQEGQDLELDALRGAKRGGTLDTFTGEVLSQDVTNLSDDDLLGF